MVSAHVVRDQRHHRSALNMKRPTLVKKRAPANDARARFPSGASDEFCCSSSENLNLSHWLNIDSSQIVWAGAASLVSSSTWKPGPGVIPDCWPPEKIPWQMLTRQMLTRHMLTTLMEKETFAHNFFYNLYLWRKTKEYTNSIYKGSKPLLLLLLNSNSNSNRTVILSK